MLIFLDESGDAGFKFTTGSSTHFVVALVIFDDPLDAEETALTIKRLRQQLKMQDKFEFKFNKMNDERRALFLEAIRDAKFRVRVMVVDKRKLPSDYLGRSTDSFYNYFVSQALQRNAAEIVGAKLRVDGSGSREFKNAFKAHLRRNVETGVIANCKFVDSADDSLIQLADMIAGAVYRSYHATSPDTGFLERIWHKIEELWDFS